MDNPWSIQSIYDLQYFICPSCTFKDHSKQEIINHVYEVHPECVQFLDNINDNSLHDIVCPRNNPLFKIKEEYVDVEESNLENDPLDCDSNIVIKEESVDIDDDFGDKIIIFNENPIANIAKNQITCSKSETLPSKTFDIENSKVKVEKNIINVHYPAAKNEITCSGIETMPRKAFNIENSKVRLEKNIINWHYPPGNQGIKVRCIYCSKCFSHPSDMEIHIKTVHEGVNDNKCHECHKCGKVFGHLSNLNTHIKFAHNQKQKAYKCEKCDKSYSSKRNLNDHVKTIHEGQKVKCDKCEKIFSSKKSLYVHIKNTHERKEDEIIIYNCDKCDKTYGNLVSLKSHVRFVHEGKKDIFTKLHQCSTCSKEFHDLNSFRRHIETVHELHKCMKCDQVFNSELFLCIHDTKDHGGKYLLNK